MKTKITTFAMVCVCLVGLSACNDSPVGAVQSAGKAIKEDNLKDFRKVLTKEMAQKYGSTEEMARIKEVLKPFNDFKISKGAVLDSIQKRLRVCSSNGFHVVRDVDVYSKSEVEIGGILSSAVTPLWIATVDCKTNYVKDTGHRGGACYKRNGQYCFISDLE